MFQIMAEGDNDSGKEGEGVSEADSVRIKAECDDSSNNADGGFNTNYDSSDGTIPSYR